MAYFSALIAVSAAAGAACLLAPDENSPSGKMLRVFSALCVIAVALSPVWTAKERVSAAIGSFEDFIGSAAGEDTSENVDSAVGRELSDAIANRVCERFSLPADRVKVAVTLDTTDAASPTLRSVRVSVTAGDGTPDPDGVAAFVREFTGVEASAVILAPS